MRDVKILMKLVDITEKKQNKGTYAGVKFSDKTKKSIEGYIKDNDIPNPLSTDKMHSTLLYSRKFCPKYTPLGEMEEALIGNADAFESWESQPDDDGNKSNCLVLKYNCDALKDRHESLMDEHGATFDYDDFTPHITFSYDAGDLDPKKLPKFEEEIEIVEEYGEDLDLDWAQKKDA